LCKSFSGIVEKGVTGLIVVYRELHFDCGLVVANYLASQVVFAGDVLVWHIERSDAVKAFIATDRAFSSYWFRKSLQEV